MMGKMRNKKIKSRKIGGMGDGRGEEVAGRQGMVDDNQSDVFLATVMVLEIKK